MEIKKVKTLKKTPKIEKNTIKFNITPEQIEKVRPYVKNFDKVILKEFNLFCVALDDAVVANLDKDYKHTKISKMLEDVLNEITEAQPTPHHEKGRVTVIDDHITTYEEDLERFVDIPRQELEEMWREMEEKSKKFGLKGNKPFDAFIKDLEEYKKKKSENS